MVSVEVKTKPLGEGRGQVVGGGSLAAEMNLLKEHCGMLNISTLFHYCCCHFQV